MMALIESCCGCSLAVSSAVLGVYLLVAYIIAFIIELWWILDSSMSPPVAAYLLCLGYFILFAFSSLLLHGLSIKRATFLLLWLFMMGILLGPEAGLVLYMSIHYWRITSINGLIEITCWACRLLVNAAGILCVQSLHSKWREEKSVLLRLEALKTQQQQQSPIHKPNQTGGGRTKGIRLPSMIKSYQNHGFDDDYVGVKLPEGKTLEMMPSVNGPNFPQDDRLFRPRNYDPSYADSYFMSGFNEFNASSFDPSVIDSRLPYLTLRKKPKSLLDLTPEIRPPGKNIPKTHSLLDLSSKNLEVVKYQNGRCTPPLKSANSDSEEDNEDNVTGSLDRKIIKNKNLKILKKFSPFCRKKPTELINIYRINPPMGVAKEELLDMSNIDSQLNRLYSNRGMYTFEEKTRKIVFYPPEFFHKRPNQGFRSSAESIGRSLSHSSVDSEDIKQISDVAL